MTTLLPANPLDLSMLEPGDILLVANPTDMPAIRWTLFWSHVGLYSTQGDVIDAVREPRGEYAGEDVWFQVRRSSLASYEASHDLLALRPPLVTPARRAAALFAESKVGAPYAANVGRILWGRGDSRGYSCASLAWEAYNEQGLDLAPVPAWCRLNVVPLLLARDRRLQVVGRGTRYAELDRRTRLARWWLTHILHAGVLPEATT